MGIKDSQLVTILIRLQIPVSLHCWTCGTAYHGLTVKPCDLFCCSRYRIDTFAEITKWILFRSLLCLGLIAESSLFLLETGFNIFTVKFHHMCERSILTSVHYIQVSMTVWKSSHNQDLAYRGLVTLCDYRKTFCKIIRSEQNKKLVVVVSGELSFCVPLNISIFGILKHSFRTNLEDFKNSVSFVI